MCKLMMTASLEHRDEQVSISSTCTCFLPSAEPPGLLPLRASALMNGTHSCSDTAHQQAAAWRAPSHIMQPLMSKSSLLLEDRELADDPVALFVTIL